MDKLAKLDALLADISVKGDDVNKMFAARKLLYEIFTTAQEAQEEQNGTGRE